VRSVVDAKAGELNAPVTYVDANASSFHEENTTIARAVLQELVRQGLELPTQCIEEGLVALPMLRKAEYNIKTVGSQCNVTVVLDVGHNTAGLSRITEELKA
jgi:folylpolyglutamate synthase/dihydropteroate synthase